MERERERVITQVVTAVTHVAQEMYGLGVETEQKAHIQTVLSKNRPR